MSADGDEWKGYLNEFPATDPAGIQLTSAEPTTQSDGSPLVVQDLWLDTADLDNYPAIRRFDGTAFVLIDNTDQTTPNAFAGLRTGGGVTFDDGIDTVTIGLFMFSI